VITNILVVREYNKRADKPWGVEPDYVEGYLQEYDCYMFTRRSPVTGALNGYVVVPAGHPWHGKPYDGLDCVIVHGGVTYSGSAEDVGCNRDGWAIGFDCAHVGDMCPAFLQISSKHGGHYWDIGEVLHETLWLAVQAANSHITDYERLLPLMHEAEHKCRVSRSDGSREWIWEEPIRAYILKEKEKCC